jgi:glycosyltransferase involved in cell wall biosynthesis
MNKLIQGIRLVHVTTVPQTLEVFRGLSDYLMNRGFLIYFISSPEEKDARPIFQSVVKTYPVLMTRTINPWNDFRAILSLWRKFLEIRPAIVHAHTPKAGLLGVLAARFAGVPIVFLSIFGLPQMTMRGLKRSLLNCLTRIACLAADRVWCDSFSMRDYVVRNRLCVPKKAVVMAQGSAQGVDAERIFSSSGHEYSIRKKIRHNLSIPQESIVLGFVGRIVKDKGLHELAEAWRYLRKKRAGLHLILIGPQENKDPIDPLDMKLFNSDPRIHLVGLSHDVPSYLAAMDIFVMPSYREGFGLSNIEASAMELPIVSTRIPGCIDSVIEGTTGLLVPPRDTNSLINAIEAYINDADLRKRHGRAGRERVLRDFRPEMIWEDLYAIYIRLLKDKKIMKRGTF